MLSYLRRWLTPPIFPDEEQTRIASLLNILLLTTIFICLFDAAALLVFAPETIPTFWINGVGVAVGVGLLWIMRRGMVRLASWILCLVMWLLITYYVSISGGLRSPALDFLSLLIVIATVLLGARASIVFGVLCIVAASGLYIAGNSGLLISVEGPPTLSRLFGTNISIFIAVSLLMLIGGRSILDSLTRARNGERVLAERNQQLQREIVERQQAEKARDRLVSILETTSDLVGMADPRGNVLYLNHAGKKLLGLAEKTDVKTTTFADYFPTEVAQILLTEATPIAIREGTWSGETILLTNDGREIPVSQVLIAHRDADGNVEYLSTVIRDISERKQAEQEHLESALVKERFDLFREFLDNVSHDLKTPLTVINTSLYLLERLDDPAQKKQKLDSIRKQADLLERYVRDLLTMSRLDHAPELTLAPLDLNQLLSDIHSSLAVTAESKNLTTRLELDTTIPPILADREELSRAMMNLVENAVQYTPSGGSVLVQTYADEDKVVTRITDTGIGIALEDIPRVFERFYRTNEAYAVRAAGTGLGLSIVKKIVEIHNGTIEVQSTPGVGTTFRVGLPIAKENYC